MTLRLASVLKPELEQLGLTRLMDEVELPLIPVLASMEREGVAVDVDFLRKESAAVSRQLIQLEGEIVEQAGRSFNLNSSQQLSDVLFLELGLPTEGTSKTRSGHFSTAAKVLQGLASGDPGGIASKLLEYRELGKLKSTYLDSLPQLTKANTGRVHTTFGQTGAITGRLSSSNPNLQNIPIRSSAGLRVRKGFVARPGWSLIAADYSQVELRVLAHLSGDEALIKAFLDDHDIHLTTASAIFGVEAGSVDSNQRRFAKAINFGLIYGMGAYRLSQDTDLTLAEAEKYIETYFNRFPGIKEYLEETKLKARADGYVETIMGRRRYFPVFRGGNSSDRQAVSRAEREAVNHPVQGSAADIMKIAMIRLHSDLEESFKARLVIQVHDELIVEAPDKELEDVHRLVRSTMEQAYRLDVPLKVDSSTGKSWYELKS